MCRRILTLEHYVEEVSAIVSDLGLAAKGYHLIGHSFGTIHAINFAASSPKGLRSLVLGGALANSKVNNCCFRKQLQYYHVIQGIHRVSVGPE